MADTPTVESSRAVSVLLQREAQDDRWGQPRWHVLGVLPEPGPAPEQPTRSLAHDGDKARAYLWRGLVLRLHPDACDDYVLNLSSARPLLFVICQSGPDGDLQPVSVSADQQDGVEGQEFGETVFEITMPPVIAAWLKQWLPEHWRMSPRKGRRWQKLLEESS